MDMFTEFSQKDCRKWICRLNAT